MMLDRILGISGLVLFAVGVVTWTEPRTATLWFAASGLVGTIISVRTLIRERKDRHA